MIAVQTFAFFTLRVDALAAAVSAVPSQHKDIAVESIWVVAHTA